jgi:GTPase SAR1 family protein
MEQNKKLKLFICYSHKDNLAENPYVEQFRGHITPLKENGLIEDWYDRKIVPGKDYETKINNNLEDADIICLFISVSFLSSPECKKEKKKALELRKARGISVMPIILSPCGWKDDEEIHKLLALPTDGKPVSTFQNRDEGWQDVYSGLKKVIEDEIKIRQLKITKKFESVLQDAEMLTKAHSEKEEVLLDDIFIYPELDKYNELRDYEEKISSERLFEDPLAHARFVISGEDQSGKTTLCKMLFRELRKRNYVPVYISGGEHLFRGKIENRILSSYSEQYEGVDIDEIDKDRIIPIIDNFHLAQDKEAHIRVLSKYPYFIITVDDIFSLNIKDEKLISAFTYLRIIELKPSLRYELIKRWISLTDKDTIDYGKIDKATELIDSTLGNAEKGIMPAYPFYILSTLVTYETFAIPLHQEITSQGYCYQAFIYFYLRKEGVKEDEIDTYINFLTEIAFYFYKEKKYELSPDDFTAFIRSYLQKYVLPIKQEILLRKLGPIISADSFNNYSFRYLYLYYFFVAKYFADHLEDDAIKEEIARITGNLHVDENAYIAIFLAHHSKNIKILDDITLNALELFATHNPATLTKSEISFFDEHVDTIVKASLPSSATTPEKEREKRLKIRDEREPVQEEQKDDFLVAKELRRGIKTVEVMGCIIKNRAGSLEKRKLEEAFKEAMDVHLRLLFYFLKLIRDKKGQEDLIDFISKRLEKISEEKGGKLSKEKLEKASRTIFWNLNFFVVYGIINKIVHSLGSDKLTEIVNKVCDERNTPSSFIIKHGILMWYNKHLKTDEIVQRVGEKDFSQIADRVIKLMIANHCALHQISYQDRQKIVRELGIPTEKLLTTSYKES